MLCKNCGCDNPENANFCYRCGVELKETLSAIVDSDVLKEQRLTAHNQRLILIKRIDNCRILMLVSLILSVSVYVPYINLLTSLIAFIFTIFTMTKVVNVIRCLENYDLAWLQSLTIVRTLRFNYVLALLSVLLAIIITVAFAEDVRSISDYGEDPIKLVILLATILVFILLAFYNMAIHVWCLIRWFYIKEFLTIAKLEVMCKATENKKIISLNCV